LFVTKSIDRRNAMNATVYRSARALLVAAALAIVPFVNAQPAPCDTCGVVQSIRYVEEKGEGTGLGAVGGAVVGGVLGHQIGSGRGNTAATIVGAGAGAYAGHQVEKNVKKKKYYNVTVKLDNGTTRTLSMGSKPVVKEGERVKIVDGNRLALIAN
jgi:outer membrane lipoprotein SlyB